MTIDPRNTFWRDAARDGGIIGLVLLLNTVVHAATGFNTSLSGLVEFLALAAFIYIFARRRSMLYGSAEGFSFGQSIGYVVAMMLFAGSLSGVGNFLAVNYIAPEHYSDMLNALYVSNPLLASNPDLVERSITVAGEMLRSPIYHVFAGIGGMVIYGGLIGLFASVFIKRKPDTFANNE